MFPTVFIVYSHRGLWMARMTQCKDKHRCVFIENARGIFNIALHYIFTSYVEVLILAHEDNQDMDSACASIICNVSDRKVVSCTLGLLRC